MEMATTANSLGWNVKEERERIAGSGTLDHTVNALEMALSKAPYIYGDNFTAVDVYLGSGLLCGMLSGTVKKRHAFSKYTELLCARPAHIKANAINEQYDNEQS
ncbi:MAG: glutathione S-transferase [Pseudohongiellaceae bacterium]|jgi:glutathione S-transferase